MTRTIAGRRETRRAVESAGRDGKTSPRQHARLMTVIGRQIDNLYIQLDTHLTSMARIQLEFDELRSKLKRL